MSAENELARQVPSRLTLDRRSTIVLSGGGLLTLAWLGSLLWLLFRLLVE